MITVRKTLNEMGWPQPSSLLQTYNSTAGVIVNNTIVPQKQLVDLRFHWLRCRKAQGQFHYYWDLRLLNWGDYSTKHHSPAYH